jgi:trans-L-3-hydroxyproline dehydratase
MSTSPFWQRTEDWHTAGEPFRIVSELPKNALTQGLTVSDQRRKILQTPSHPLDLLRQSLCHEPRGSSAMYGCFVLPPDDAGAHFGVLFWHKDGFSTACGHGTIALGYWAIAHGLVPPNPGGTVDIVIDVPSGRVTARATLNDSGAPVYVDFINVASYQLSEPVCLSIDLAGKTLSMEVALSFAGAVYACVDVADLDLRVEPAQYQTFIDIARKIKAQYVDYLYQDKYDVYGVCFFKEQSESADTVFQKNVVVFADGQVDRSPCGSGTCARLAVLLAEGRVGLGKKKLVHESLVGSKFEASVMEMTKGEPFPSCIPRIRGQAHLVGKMSFFIDPGDPIYPGFVLG